MLKNKIRKISAAIALSLSCVCCVTAAVAVAVDLTRNNAENASNVATTQSLFIAGNGITVQGNVSAPTNGLEGFYVDGSKNGKSLLKWKTAEDVPETQRTGVLVTSTSESNRLTYKNYVDLNGKTKDDVIFAFQPLSSTPGVTSDFTGMKIYFTDAEDESNYFCVYFYSTADYTYAEVQMPNGVSRAYRYGGYHDIESVNSQWHYRYENLTLRNFYGYRQDRWVNYLNGSDEWSYVMEDPERQVEGGVPKAQMYLEPMTLRYDTADNTIYFDKACLLDLDHTESVGIGNEFKGFTSNRVKLSVVTLSISALQAQYMIYNVGGQWLNGETVTDTETPYFVENLPAGKELPLAGVGRAYPVYDVIAYDLVDGEISAKIYFKHELDSDYTLINGNTFTPTKTGYYTLKYETYDNSGNKAEKTYTLHAIYGIEQIAITVDSAKTEYNVGEKIFLPDFTAKGGSGTLSKAVKVVRATDGIEFDIDKSGYIQPTVAGEYDVIYSATDYLGYSAEKIVTFTVKAAQTPVFDREKPMFEKFVSGVPVRLPKPAAYDYSVSGQRQNAVVEITARGVGEKANVTETVNDYEFTPTLDKFGSQIEIEYKIYCNGKKDQAEIKTYSAEIVEVEQAYEYLVYDKSAFEIALNENGATNKFTRFTAIDAGKQTIKFAYPIYLNGSEIQLNAGSATFAGSAEICFTDAEDASNVVAIKLSYVDASSTKVEYNGKTAVIVGSFDVGSIVIKVVDGAIYDKMDNQLFVIEETLLSPTAWVSINFDAANAGDSILIKKIGTTLFQGSYRSGKLSVFKDRVQPTIITDGKISIETKYGADLIIPAAAAYDNLSSVLVTYVTVTAPDGNVILNEQVADKSYKIEASQYGKYVIDYICYDYAGNTGSINYETQVYDKVAPVIDYAGAMSYEAKVFDSVKLNRYDAYDAVDKDLTYKIMIIDANARIKVQEIGSKYTFTTKGTYVIRHVAYDSARNYAMLDIKVTVK